MVGVLVAKCVEFNFVKISTGWRNESTGRVACCPSIEISATIPFDQLGLLSLYSLASTLFTRV